MVCLLSVHKVRLHGIYTLVHYDQIAIGYRPTLRHAGRTPWGGLVQHHTQRSARVRLQIYAEHRLCFAADDADGHWSLGNARARATPGQCARTSDAM